MKWFHYRQNNRGGQFLGPAIKVYIEAADETEAARIATKHGLYCDGDGDCPCCGDRWSNLYAEVEEGDDPVPDIAEFHEALPLDTDHGKMYFKGEITTMVVAQNMPPLFGFVDGFF